MSRGISVDVCRKREASLRVVVAGGFAVDVVVVTGAGDWEDVDICAVLVVLVLAVVYCVSVVAALVSTVDVVFMLGDVGDVVGNSVDGELDVLLNVIVAVVIGAVVISVVDAVVTTVVRLVEADEDVEMVVVGISSQGDLISPGVLLSQTDLNLLVHAS